MLLFGSQVRTALALALAANLYAKEQHGPGREVVAGTSTARASYGVRVDVRAALICTFIRTNSDGDFFHFFQLTT
jgi:hypothetical protein